MVIQKIKISRNIKSNSMKTRIIYLSIILLSILFENKIFSQTKEYIEVRDFETWSSLALQYKIKKKLSFELEEQLRLANNSTEIDQYFTNFQIDYKILKNWEFSSGFRYIKANDPIGFKTNLRYNIDLSYDHKISNFDFQYRLRFQNKWELPDFSIPKNQFRLKTSVEYNIKNWKLDPNLSFEIFKDNETGFMQSFDKYRFTLKTDYKIKKIGKIGAFYRIEHELNKTYPKTTYIVGLKFKYTF